MKLNFGYQLAPFTDYIKSSNVQNRFFIIWLIVVIHYLLLPCLGKDIYWENRLRKCCEVSWKIFNKYSNYVGKSMIEDSHLHAFPSIGLLVWENPWNYFPITLPRFFIHHYSILMFRNISEVTLLLPASLHISVNNS